MAKQLNFSNEQIVPTALHTEVQRSYLEYAMSVIVGRALPDVRDGLKPVHRRILYAMHELGLTPDRPFRKCARVVGDVLGKYHPHGDQAVYDALVRMVQDFSSRYPLLAGHGNFGSVDNDPPAAMRYTETRLAAIGHSALLAEVGEATVDFIDNFDSSQQEPVVLPAQLPNLLLNGSSGIAVGMATNIPPHNLGEVIDGLIALIDRPNLSNEKLFDLIPGPDFPTGAEIIDTQGIHDAYRTGRGGIPIRGIASFEEIQPGRGKRSRQAIVVTELPYQVNKASWITKIASLVNQGRIDGISDIRDESDRDGMRVVIELKREAQPQLILNDLYKMTPLQTNFGALMLAIEDGQPRQLSLREILEAFLTFREETLIRQYSHELAQKQARAHIVAGQIVALNHLDAVIEILRRAPDGTTARVSLQERFELSDQQADSILSMPLRRLTSLEQQKLRDEAEELAARIGDLQTLVEDRSVLMKSLKKELRALKKKFDDPRRTRIQTSAERRREQQVLAEIAAEESEETFIVEFTRKGYVRRSSPKAYSRRQSRVESSAQLDEFDDITIQTELTNPTEEILVLTRDGKAYTVSVGDIPIGQRQQKGVPLIGLLPNAAGSTPDDVAAQIVLNEARLGQQLILITTKGRVKRLPAQELSNLTGRGLTAVKLKTEDTLQYALITPLGSDLVLASSGGRLLRFRVNDEQLPELSRTAQGPQGIRLPKSERLVGCVPVQSKDALLLVSTKGFAKKMLVSNFKTANRGGIGSQSFKFSLKNDSLASMILAVPETTFTVVTNEDRCASLMPDEVPLQGRSQPCDRLFTTRRTEAVTDTLISGLPDEALKA
ncbi:DNA gyrase subunit A [Leptolyngbya sp. BC1307]|uniref:DNA gyrase subunit A n=1 Tax=Leptolyngbya sp. BC1307 TaxID=2029589 RepID=UPI000EFC70F6|nr:DNA gyrase subunit A [Leptolyngbya sp. BC1307]